MAPQSPGTNVVENHVLQCMEIWSGSKSIENIVSSPGIDGWIYSQPYLGQPSGGDVHYLSLCVGGIVTRLVLADVAGHGQIVASTSNTLRGLLRRFMNVKQQDRLVAEINSEFARIDSDDATIIALIVSGRVTEAFLGVSPIYSVGCGCKDRVGPQSKLFSCCIASITDVGVRSIGRDCPYEAKIVATKMYAMFSQPK